MKFYTFVMVSIYYADSGLSLACNSAYKDGKTNKVNSVEDIIPPITTVAKGLCTSEPIPVFSAMGINPSEATSAVVNTGRNRVKAP